MVTAWLVIAVGLVSIGVALREKGKDLDHKVLYWGSLLPVLSGIICLGFFVVKVYHTYMF